MVRRALLEPIAAAVFRQEALEGDLRSAHARLRACAAEAALCRGGPAEQVPPPAPRAANPVQAASPG